MNDFLQFLLDAKRKTYASETGNIRAADPVYPGARQLEYIENTYCYRDTYYGNRFFAGQETIWNENQPWWSMVYSGGLIANAKQEGDISKRLYIFLRGVLLRIEPSRPFRGPSLFQAEDMIYRCNSEGNLSRFNGSEEIWEGKLLLYRLHFSGGILQ